MRLALESRIRHPRPLREDLIDRGSSLRRGPGIRPEIRIAERGPPRRQGGREGRPREDARGRPVAPRPGAGGRGPGRARRRGRERARPRVPAGGTRGDRIPLHYEWAEKLLATGEAYVCECDAETLRKNREAMRACVHRIQDVDETIAMWKAMLAGEYGEGEAVVRLKTDMAHPNPAFRDRVLFRIAERDHPRVGDRYRVWPMLEFSWAVDDTLLGIPHVLRRKVLVLEDQLEPSR